jgi:PPOX class probable F420-dependent enzyme
VPLSQAARDVLSDVRFGVLATVNADGTAQQTLMWYELIGERILMNTAAGRVKERNLRRDPRASLCVADDWRFVTVSGRVTLDDDPEVGQADIARLARRYLTPTDAERAIVEFRRQRRITINLPIERVITLGLE